MSASTSRSATPALPTDGQSPLMSPSPPPPEPPLVAVVGEQLDVEYQVHELPSESTTSPTQDIMSVPSLEGRNLVSRSLTSLEDRNLVSTSLTARIEALEGENMMLKTTLSTKEGKPAPFGINCIKHNDRWVSFYTGFNSYRIFLAFFQFLGPAVNKLHYWGTRDEPRKRQRSMKLSPMDQLLLTLVKLRLNLKVLDLAFRFGISPAAVSRCVTTWICFLYQHLKEIDWMPSVEQVAGTLPPVFREKYPNTYAIVDASEIFIETPTDLHMQSSTWSSYKHHNTAKFVIAVTPNGCVSYISPVYVGSTSDIELTQQSGLLNKLDGKAGVSIMADRGFTIKDMLQEKGIELNMPPFMEGRSQLPEREVQEGRRIASVRIHMERAIGRIKTFTILKQTMPISLARLSNQIVCVCAYLSNFKTVLVSPETSAELEESDIEEVDEYFDELSDSDGSGDEYNI